ncbi:hypothetical protein JCM9533A_06490 [Catenuloplanes niger JCM 9533]
MDTSASSGAPSVPGRSQSGGSAQAIIGAHARSGIFPFNALIHRTTTGSSARTSMVGPGTVPSKPQTVLCPSCEWKRCFATRIGTVSSAGRPPRCRSGRNTFGTGSGSRYGVSGSG